jgi:hypothetical protein
MRASRSACLPFAFAAILAPGALAQIGAPEQKDNSGKNPA